MQPRSAPPGPLPRPAPGRARAQARAEDRASARTWFTHSWEVLHPYGSGGVYPNFPDPDLANPGPAYYGENYAWLMRVNATDDPDDLFGLRNQRRES
jgi:hypothetical protein